MVCPEISQVTAYTCEAALAEGVVEVTWAAGIGVAVECHAAGRVCGKLLTDDSERFVVDAMNSDAA